jgi:hypothetical protein
MRLETRYECYECRAFRLERDKTFVVIGGVLVDLVELECGHLRNPGFASPMEGLGTMRPDGFHKMTTAEVEEHVRRAWQEGVTKMAERGQR